MSKSAKRRQRKKAHDSHAPAPPAQEAPSPTVHVVPTPPQDAPSHAVPDTLTQPKASPTTVLAPPMVLQRLQTLDASTVSAYNFPAKFDCCVSFSLVFLCLPDVTAMTLVCKRFRIAVVHNPEPWHRLCDQLAFIPRLQKVNKNDIVETLMPNFLLPLSRRGVPDVPPGVCITPENNGLRKFLTLQCVCKLLFHSHQTALTRCLDNLRQAAGRTSYQLSSILIHYCKQPIPKMPYHHRWQLEHVLPLVAKLVAESEGKCDDASVPGSFPALILALCQGAENEVRGGAIRACGFLFTSGLAMSIWKKIWEEAEKRPLTCNGQTCLEALSEAKSPAVLPSLLLSVYRSQRIDEFQEIPFDEMKMEASQTECFQSDKKARVITAFLGGVPSAVTFLRGRICDWKEPEKKANSLSVERKECRDIENGADFEALLALLSSPSTPMWIQAWVIRNLGRTTTLKLLTNQPQASLVLSALLAVINSPRTCDEECQGCQNVRHVCAYNLSRWALRAIVRMVQFGVVAGDVVRSAILSELTGNLEHFKVSKCPEITPEPAEDAEESEYMRNPRTADLAVEAQLWLVWVLLEARLVQLPECGELLRQLNNPLFEVRPELARVLSPAGVSLREYMVRFFVPIWRPGTRLGWILQAALLGLDVGFKSQYDRTENKARHANLLALLESHLFHDLNLPVTFFVSASKVDGVRSGHFSRLYVRCSDDEICMLDVTEVGPFARCISHSRFENFPANTFLERDASGKVALQTSKLMQQVFERACRDCGVTMLPYTMRSGGRWRAQLCSYDIMASALDQQLFYWCDD